MHIMGSTVIVPVYRITLRNRKVTRIEREVLYRDIPSCCRPGGTRHHDPEQ